MMRVLAFDKERAVHSLIRWFLIPVLTSVAAAAHAQGAAALLGSFDPLPGTAGKVECPSAGGWDDVYTALLYELPSGDHVLTVLRRSDDGIISILVSKQLPCVFRRLEFHSPARGQPLPQ